MAQSVDYRPITRNGTRSFPFLLGADPVGGVKNERAVLGRDGKGQRTVITRNRSHLRRNLSCLTSAIGDRATGKASGVALDHPCAAMSPRP